VVSVAFSPDGTRIASGGWDAKIRIRPLDQSSLLPTDPAGFREWLEAHTTAAVDARGNLASPRTP
jgi:WD40 repeat protein